MICLLFHLRLEQINLLQRLEGLLERAYLNLQCGDKCLGVSSDPPAHLHLLESFPDGLDLGPLDGVKGASAQLFAFQRRRRCIQVHAGTCRYKGGRNEKRTRGAKRSAEQRWSVRR